MARNLACIAKGLLAGALMTGLASGALAAEIKLEMKGGGFSITGQLKEYDGSKYVIQSSALGNMTIDASRFDCVSGNCPSAPMKVALVTGAPSPSDLTGTISISGSNTVGNALMPALVEAFADKNGLQTTEVVGQNPLDLKIKLSDESGTEVAMVDLHRHGSSTSFRALEAGEAAIGMSSRPVKDKEVAKLAALGLGDMRAPTHEHVLGLDGLMVIVSQKNPAVSIPQDKLAAIFSGQITDWSELGYPPGKINVHAPDKDSGTFDTFKSLVLKPAKVELAADAKRTHNHKEQSDWVSQDPNAIGVVGLAYQRNAKALNIETTCGMIVQPSIFSVKTEEYPLSRRLYLYTPGTPKQPLARRLLQFALSDEAQPVVSDVDFIDQTPEAIAIEAQNARVAYALNAQNDEFNLNTTRAFLNDTKGAQRLSSTLRFELGSFRLDTKAIADVQRLASLLKSDAYKGKQVMLLGFADSTGDFGMNMRLSKARANAVQEALRGAGFTGAVTKAYSEMAPVACNDTDKARNFNRRVEVWVK